jgi:flavin reductase (DIM6/NTAB) family NADH-FMN oxidoreductase RutF
MPKRLKDPQTVLQPNPVIMVSCADRNGRSNILTIAWAGIVSSNPPMVSISIRPGRFSHEMIKDTGEFVINMPDEKLLYATDLCGSISGRDTDKFQAAKLTPEPSSLIKAPMIKECPVNLECKVKHFLHLGTHDMFIAEIVSVHVDESVLDENGKLDITKANPLAYMPWTAQYWTLKEAVGKYGFSIKKG